MKAIRIHNYGGPSVLIYEEAPEPKPANDQILVKVHAAGVNPIDWKLRSGRLQDWLPHSLPFVLGVDFSGIVEKAGSVIKDYKAGDEVYGEAHIVGPNGSYA